MNNEAKIWNYLYSQLKNPYGVAGIMGNMYAESGLKPTNLQNSFEKKLGYTDESYTTAIDKKIYTNFAKDKAGYGLVQWTYYTLKQELLDYAIATKRSIGDLDMQLEFLCKQLKETYSTVWDTLRHADCIQTASNTFLLKFERPAKQDEAVQNQRIKYAQEYYDKYAIIEKPKEEIGNVSIGYVTKDEKGKITGGIQIDKDICIRSWYNKPWDKVYRPINPEVAEKIAIAMEQICGNPYIRYNPRNRTSLFDCAQQVNWDISQIKTDCYTDCSAAIAVCINAAGIKKVPKTMNTNTVDLLLSRTGKFSTMTDSTVLKTSDYLQRGDILFSSGHMAIVLSNGLKSNNIVFSPIKGNVTLTGTGIGTVTTSDTVKVYTGASIIYKQIGTLKVNTKLEVISIVSNGWYKVVWPAAASGYAYIPNTNTKYVPKVNKDQQSAAITTNFLVTITADALNIRKGPDLTYPIAGCIRNKGVYTIIKQKDNWGYLKSGIGWICLDYTKKMGV